MPAALDQNLYTLKIKRSDDEPGTLDLIDANTLAPVYRKRIVPANHKVEEGEKERGVPVYDLWDPLSDSLLSTLSAQPKEASKKRTISLYNPDIHVPLNFTGTMSFRWQFAWEEHTFEFKREECFLLRRPDPPVLVAVYEFNRKQTRGEVGSIQLLDYNLTRFDVDDRKGLEVVMLTGLLSFQEQITGQPGAFDEGGGLPSPTAMLSRVVSASATGSGGGPPPPILPPKDIGLTVAGLQILEKSAPNEITVTSQFEIDEYAEHACKILADPKILYVLVRSKTASDVPKVVAVASLVKRMRYKGGAHDEELHQYAKYSEDDQGGKGPKVIKLDEPSGAGKAYKPPTALSIHLSKIPMPELQPKAKPGGTMHGKAASTPAGSSSGGGLAVPAKKGGRGRSNSPSPTPSQVPSPFGNQPEPGAGGNGSRLKKSKPSSPNGPVGALSAVQIPQQHHQPPSQPQAQPRPQQKTKPPSSNRNSFWGFGGGSSSSPPASASSPSSAMPGSYFPATSSSGPPPRPPPPPNYGNTSSHPTPGPPPPPPPPPPQQNLGSILNTLTHGSGSTTQNVSDAAKTLGQFGASLYGKYANRRS